MILRLFFCTLLLVSCKSAETIVSRPAGVSAGRLLIRDVRVVDVVAGTATEHVDVVIEGSKIVSIEPTSASKSAERVIEGQGATLIPGLIDMHAHVGSSADPPWDRSTPDVMVNLSRYLYSGVTTVFDTGGMDDDNFELREKIRRGEVLGPQLFAAGPVFTAPGGHPIPMLREGLPPIIEGYLIGHMTREVGTPEEARAAVHALAEGKPDFIKMVVDRIPASAPRIDPSVAQALVAQARADGVRVVAHIGTTTDAIDAARAGISAWIHGVYKERIPDAKIAELAAFGMPMAPTLVVFDSYAGLGREKRVPTALEREIVDAKVLASYDAIPADFELDPEMQAMVEGMAREREHALENVRRLRAAGVTILAGSDSQAAVFHGPGLHRELVLLAKAGLPPIEVLRAATLYSARFLTQKEDPPFGVVAVGAEADLLLVGGDPLLDVAAISNIREVILDGLPLIRRSISSSL